MDCLGYSARALSLSLSLSRSLKFLSLSLIICIYFVLTVYVTCVFIYVVRLNLANRSGRRYPADGSCTNVAPMWHAAHQSPTNPIRFSSKLGRVTLVVSTALYGVNDRTVARPGRPRRATAEAPGLQPCGRTFSAP